MGNVLGAPGPAPGPLEPAIVLEEDSECRAVLHNHLHRQANNPHLRRILSRSGSAAAVCVGLGGGAHDVGGLARDGFNALHVACAVGWDDLVLKLLEAGKLEVDTLSREGYTPLMIAAMSGSAGAVRLLLERGAQLCKRSRRGATAISFAAQAPSSLDTLRQILAHPSCTPALVKQLGFRQRSPLVLAVLTHGSPAIVQALVGAGADPSETCPTHGCISVLHTAAHMARVDAMRELIAAGAEVNAAAEDGVSVLQECFMQAPTRQRSEAAKRQMFSMLVAAGANVNACIPEREYTVLHFALASCKEEATANLLLDSGLDLSIAVNTPVGLGDSRARHTLLHLACIRGWSRLAERLVLAGADLTLRNKDGLQPLHAAVLNCHSATVAALLRLGADPLGTCPDFYPNMHTWKLQRGLQAVQALMQAGGGDDLGPVLASLLGNDDLHSGDTPCLTAVDLACCVARHIPTVEAFVERGVLPSAAALKLGEHAVPLMRAVVERPMLTAELGALLPPRFRTAAREALLCLGRTAVGRDGCGVCLTSDAVAAVLHKAAFPVSQWADPAWLAAQSVREPLARPRAAISAAQPGAGPPAPHAGGAPPHGVHILGPGLEPPPPLMQAVLNQVEQMQQQMGVAGVQPQMFIMHQQGGGAPGAGGGAPVPGGLHPMPQQLQQQLQQNQGVHVVQFQIQLGGDMPFPMPPPVFGNPMAAPGFPAGAAGGGAGVGPLPMPAGGMPPGLAGMWEQMGQMIEGLAGPVGGMHGIPMMFEFDDMMGWMGEEEEEEEGDDGEEEEGGEMDAEQLDQNAQLAAIAGAAAGAANALQQILNQDHAGHAAALAAEADEAAAAAAPSGQAQVAVGGAAGPAAGAAAAQAHQAGAPQPGQAPLAESQAAGPNRQHGGGAGATGRQNADQAGPSGSGQGAGADGKRPASGSSRYDLRERSGKRQRRE